MVLISVLLPGKMRYTRECHTRCLNTLDIFLQIKESPPRGWKQGDSAPIHRTIFAKGEFFGWGCMYQRYVYQRKDLGCAAEAGVRVNSFIASPSM